MKVSRFYSTINTNTTTLQPLNVFFILNDCFLDHTSRHVLFFVLVLSVRLHMYSNKYVKYSLKFTS